MTLYLPSEEAKRGDEYLDNARAIRDEWKNGNGDESRTRLEARDFLATQETYEEQEKRVGSTAEAIYRSFFGYRDAFPSPEQELSWASSVWTMACTKTGTTIALSANLMEKLGVVGPQFRAAVKGKIAPLVERHYGFETSKAPKSLTHNIELARALKTDGAFSKGDEENELPYHHRIIQQAINVVCFSNLFNPMPYEAIALVLAVIECCIDEWSNGPWITIPFAYENYKDVYCNHLEVLKGLSDQGLKLRGCDPLRQLRYEIFNRGRDHAGVPRRFINQGDHWTRDQVNAACDKALAM
ncbi:hypothetical protein BGY98DRAFT_935757 [Russula aff. rugulosa BPL654]|nr:hypothetical protein BGY98DRAFT_935757 [Russula aff. rugulosa BPL654]